MSEAIEACQRAATALVLRCANADRDMVEFRRLSGDRMSVTVLVGGQNDGRPIGGEGVVITPEQIAALREWVLPPNAPPFADYAEPPLDDLSMFANCPACRAEELSDCPEDCTRRQLAAAVVEHTTGGGKG